MSLSFVFFPLQYVEVLFIISVSVYLKFGAQFRIGSLNLDDFFFKFW